MQLGHYRKADKMVGSSRRMRELREMIHQVAGSDATITITGESGTGKELVANLVQATSGRDDKPSSNPTATPSATPCSSPDLFGYEKGAFTGAQTQDRQVRGGRRRHHFLDEIGDIVRTCRCRCCAYSRTARSSASAATNPVQVDVRIFIAATNVDLAQAVKGKKFGSTSTTGSTSSPSTSPCVSWRTSSSWSTTLSTTTAAWPSARRSTSYPSR